MNFPKNIFEKKIVAAEIWSRSFFHSQNYRFRGLYHQNTSKMGFYSARRFPSLLLAREINGNASKINRELKKQNPRVYPISFFWSNLFQNFYFPLNWEEFFIFHPILKPKEEVFQFVNFVNFSNKIVFSKILSPLRFQMKRKIS